MISFEKLNSLVSNEVTPKKNSSKNLYISVDNRELSAEHVFIAIVGERYNPLNDLAKVEKSGCRCVVVEKNKESLALIQNYRERIDFLFVDSVFDFIQDLGALVAQEFRLRAGKIIAISGSNGKTTTKEMLYHLLSGDVQNDVICTQKNNNNHLGVPFTLFQITEKTKYAIVELGSNHPGEIEHLCKMIEPQYGVTTNIGDTHLEFFQTQENVYKEEAILQHYCSELFFINKDDKFLKTIKSHEKNYSYSCAEGTDSVLVYSKSNISVNGKIIENKNITGKHNFVNLAVAFIIATELTQLESSLLLKRASSFLPTSNRSEWISLDQLKIYLDAYNANPSSMRVAIDGFMEKALESTVSKSEICLILGDMNELGEDASRYHEELGKYVRTLNVGTSIFIGKFADDYAVDNLDNTFKFKDVDSMSRHMKPLLSGTKYIFIKGSRSLQLERILDIK